MIRQNLTDNSKIFSITEPHTLGFIDLIIRWLHIDQRRFSKEFHPEEDAFLASEQYPIFAVADGVTLEVGKDGKYPNPSGAGVAAKIFCEEAVRAGERLYNGFTDRDVQSVFKAANDAVGEYNKKEGRTRETVNYLDYDLFAATAAFALLKDGVLYWGSLCDSYVAYFDTIGTRVFKSPICWPDRRVKEHRMKNVKNNEEKRKIIHSIFRNGVDGEGNLIGYGVVTGEEAALRYLNKGSFPLREGGVLALFTDGFEDYFDLPEFVNLLSAWPEDLESKVKCFTLDKSQSDMPRYGRERTLIAVKF